MVLRLRALSPTMHLPVSRLTCSSRHLSSSSNVVCRFRFSRNRQREPGAEFSPRPASDWTPSKCKSGLPFNTPSGAMGSCSTCRYTRSTAPVLPPAVSLTPLPSKLRCSPAAAGDDGIHASAIRGLTPSYLSPTPSLSHCAPPLPPSFFRRWSQCPLPASRQVRVVFDPVSARIR